MDKSSGQAARGTGDPRVSTANAAHPCRRRTPHDATLPDAALRLKDELRKALRPIRCSSTGSARGATTRRAASSRGVDPAHVGKSGTASQIFPNSRSALRQQCPVLQRAALRLQPRQVHFQAAAINCSPRQTRRPSGILQSDRGRLVLCPVAGLLQHGSRAARMKSLGLRQSKTQSLHDTAPPIRTTQHAKYVGPPRTELGEPA